MHACLCPLDGAGDAKGPAPDLVHLQDPALVHSLSAQNPPCFCTFPASFHHIHPSLRSLTAPVRTRTKRDSSPCPVSSPVAQVWPPPQPVLLPVLQPQGLCTSHSLCQAHTPFSSRTARAFPAVATTASPARTQHQSDTHQTFTQRMNK